MICPQCRIELPEESNSVWSAEERLISPAPGVEKLYALTARAVLTAVTTCAGQLAKRFPKIDYQQPQSYTPKHLADKILTTRSAIEGERKIVTVMFADVAGFSSISEKLDPEDIHAVMDGCFRIPLDEDPPLRGHDQPVHR